MTLNFPPADPLLPCIKVKVIEMSMSKHAMHKSTDGWMVYCIINDLIIVVGEQHNQNSIQSAIMVFFHASQRIQDNTIDD